MRKVTGTKPLQVQFGPDLVTAYKSDGAPGETRTPDLRFRKPLLCPAELPGPCEWIWRDATLVNWAKRNPLVSSQTIS
jgi:hypothetical protein